MKTNLEVIRKNLYESLDRFELDEKEKELIDKISNAKKASELPVTLKDVKVIRAIKKRLTLTSQDKKRIDELSQRIKRLPVTKSAKKTKILV